MKNSRFVVYKGVRLAGQWFPKVRREAANILQNFLKGDAENERADPIYSFDSFG